MAEDNVKQNAKAQMTIVTDLRFWDYLVQGQKQPHSSPGWKPSTTCYTASISHC